MLSIVKNFSFNWEKIKCPNVERYQWWWKQNWTIIIDRYFYAYLVLIGIVIGVMQHFLVSPIKFLMTNVIISLSCMPNKFSHLLSFSFLVCLNACSYFIHKRKQSMQSDAFGGYNHRNDYLYTHMCITVFISTIALYKCT